MGINVSAAGPMLEFSADGGDSNTGSKIISKD